MKETKDLKTNQGITLIALVITIIVMLILVGVSISMAVNGGLFNYAGKAVGDTKNAINAENEIGNGGVTVDGKEFATVDDYLHYADAEDFVLKKENRVKIGYTSETQELEIPEVFYDETDKKWYKVVEIAEECFYNGSDLATNLKSVTIPGTVKKIGERAFGYWTSLETVVLNEGIESIGGGAFCYSNISTINLPNTITEIGNSAFSDCRKLNNVVIPKGIETIKSSTFYSWGADTSISSSLRKMTIPKTVKKIEGFNFMYSVAEINFEGTEEEWKEITIDEINTSNGGLKNATINYNYSYDS